MGSVYDSLIRAADAVAARLGRAPVGVVLGSGLSEALDCIEGPRFMEFADIPDMPETGAAGHRGALLSGKVGGVPVLASCGRIHLYEGRSMDEVAAPVRLLSLLGAQTLVVTSAVGSADPDLKPGHIMLVEDHINFSGVNVLAGVHDARLGTRYPDMTASYDPDLIRVFQETAELAGVEVSTGVLAHFRGPSYETPAEVRMSWTLGARAVGMSMVPDVMVARQHGMHVAGLACVTNMAAGMGDRALSHEAVLVTSAGIAAGVQALLMGALPRLASFTPAQSP